jgi:DNA (cytosine-5)-methyltransferase 1
LKKKLTAMSLFSGAGGDTVGLEDAGFKVIAYSEIWNKARETHDLNFPDSEWLGSKVGGDITQISDEEFKKYQGKIDLIFAGFPCQGFSHAGKKDSDDPRNKLFWEFVRATEIIKPKWIIGENVAGLLNRKTDDGQGMIGDIICEAFEGIGYTMAEAQVLNAEDFGVPQKRRRVFFVGSRDGIKFDFPEPTHLKDNFVGIKNVLEQNLEKAIEIDPDKIPHFNHDNVLDIDSKIDLCLKTPHPFLKLRASEDRISFGKRITPNHIELSDLEAPTKTIHCGYAFQPRLFVPIRYKDKYYSREFTTSELAQIQSFPKNYKFSGHKNDIIKQIGNAVPPVLSKVIAQEIIKIDPSLIKRK